MAPSVPTPEPVSDAARIALRPELEEGIRLYNEGKFFEAHEAWEILWLAAQPGAPRRCLQGLIQVAAALHKLLVGRSVRGAAKLLERALSKLEGLPADYLGVALGPLRDGSRRCLVVVRELEAGAGGAEAFDRTMVPRLERS